MDEPQAKRPRVEIKWAIKKEICKRKDAQPNMTKKDIMEFVKNQYGLSIGRSTVYDILKDKDKWLHTERDDRARAPKKARHASLERALILWYRSSRNKGAITDEGIILKAKKLGQEFGITEFSYSRGWLSNFKERHGLGKIKLRSGARNVSTENLNIKGEELREVMEQELIQRMIGSEQQSLSNTYENTMADAPDIATEAVLVKSEPMPEDSQIVKGYDFNEGVDYHKLFTSMVTTGFQATNVGKAIIEINRMIDCKFQEIPECKKTEVNLNPCGRETTNCTIFLSYTSNLISSGTREAIRYLVEHNMVDCIVSTAGGVEEDFIKCLAPTYIGDFALKGRELRSKGINRIGNLLVPNSNYCLFENWLVPILDQMLEEQTKENTLWTPSKIISRLGKEIDNPESVYYWAYKNNIPVLCPALTDGSLGDMIYFHSYQKPGLIVDIVEDIRLMNSQAVHAVNSGMIILGGGLIKHHTCNANLMRNGADFSVFVNTAHEFDGSDSGARPDEAISWGKIKATASPVKVSGEASVIFPILLAETFARREQEFKDFYSNEESKRAV